MRKSMRRRFILSALLLLGICGWMTTTAYGEVNGGAVSTKGQITLTTEEPTPSTDSTSSSEPTPTSESSSSTLPPTGSSQSPLTPKPMGKLPSTGELVKTSLSISGVILLVLLLIVFLWKRKKDQKSQEEGNR